MEKFRVLIADDHESVRGGLRAVIESMPGWEVCAEVKTGREAVKSAEALCPDIAILDMNMPELNGLDATRQIRKSCPNTEVLLFTANESEDLVKQVFEAGARSYVFKTDGMEVVIAALRALSQHKPYFTTEIGEILFSRLLQKKGGSEETESGEGRLSDREREIVQLLCEGLGNKEVAAKLGISVKTVETHRSTVMKKLKLESFSELVRYAIRNHIISA